MRYLFGCLCVLALGVMPLVGCGEDTGAGGGGGSAGSGGSGGTDLCEGVECEDDGNQCTEDVCSPADGTCGVPVENGTVCTNGACLDSTCESLVTVGGIVAFGGAPPGDGSRITVSVDGTSLSTTTDVSGRFSFDVFPGDWIFVTSKEDMAWGGIQLETVPTSDLKLEVGLDEDIPVVEEECMIEIDEAKGLVSLSFNPVSGEGGETATLSVSHGGAVTDDADGNCVVTETLPARQRDLSFFNVDLTEELIVTPKGPDGYECSLERPEAVYPVRASFHTRQVGVRCASVP